MSRTETRGASGPPRGRGTCAGSTNRGSWRHSDVLAAKLQGALQSCAPACARSVALATSMLSRDTSRRIPQVDLAGDSVPRATTSRRALGDQATPVGVVDLRRPGRLEEVPKHGGEPLGILQVGKWAARGGSRSGSPGPLRACGARARAGWCCHVLPRRSRSASRSQVEPIPRADTLSPDVDHRAQRLEEGLVGRRALSSGCSARAIARR